MASNNSWFVIINPTSGNGSSRRKWPQIEILLNQNNFEYSHCFTEYAKHSINLTHSAINQGFRKFICIGGDGTIHNIVNGIMSQNKVSSTSIKLGVIPIGTGNDWVKTHKISKDIKRAVLLIKNNEIKHQDIGKIEFPNQNLPTVFFNNLAGIGFDAYVVSRVEKYKNLGSLAYFAGAFLSMFNYKSFQAVIYYNSQKITSKALMILVGLCRFSGGGMQLTNEVDPGDGLFDISIADNFSKIDLVRNMFRLFNGKLFNSSKIISAKGSEVTIKPSGNSLPFIQADGEIVGQGEFRVSIIPKALSFYA